MSNSAKRPVCCALLLVCLGAAALLPFCAMPALAAAKRSFQLRPDLTVNVTALVCYYVAAAVLAAVALLVSCAGILRALGAEGDRPKRLVILGQWFAVPLDALLCITCWSWKTEEKTLLVFWPLLAIVLILFALVFVRALNKDLPD